MHPHVPARAIASAPEVSQPNATGDVSTCVAGHRTTYQYATPARFTTQAPDLLVEKAQGTPLFAAFDDLQARVVAWTTRLARETLASERSAALVAQTAPEDERQFDGRKRTSPSRRHTQAAGEALHSTGGRSAYFAVLDVTAQWAPSPGHEAADIVGDSSIPIASVPSSTSLANTNRTDKTNKTHTTSTCPPPWLLSEMETFFQDKLARAIQQRETELVNTMHDCVQQELQEKERRVERESDRIATLEAQLVEFEKVREHFQSKLDRRIAENNALRKDFYKQLLMLRDIVAKNRNDPRTLRVLEEVMASVASVKSPSRGSDSQETGKPSAWPDQSRKQFPHANNAPGGASSSIGASGTATSMRREKDKWEQRAREAVAENQQLQEQILLLKQQLEEARGLDGELWFASAEHGLYERQRIIDCVYKSKCTWEQVGEAVVELLNNETVWEAVEDSAYREKSRVSRGLEALILRVEAMAGDRRRESVSGEPDDVDEEENEASGGTRRSGARRRSAFSQGSRMVACRTCNGSGYLDASNANGNQVEQEDDSYLRRTLAQVLELKTSLEEANNRTNEVEQQLLRTVMDGAHIKEKLDKIEHTRAHSVDSGLQVDLDDEEIVDVDEILQAYSSSDTPDATNSTRRRGGRYKQYEHLIVELKSLLTERDVGLSEMRTAVSDAQARLVTVQRISQQEQERLQTELQTVKASLALALQNRSEVIEEKQAAVNLLLRNMERKKSQALSTKSFLLPRTSVAEGDGAESDTSDVASDEDDETNIDDDVIRSEIIARRYTQAISRVQAEHDEQQQRLKQAEEELGQETDRRKRTNSISLGNIVVTMASHPRDLFKALSTAHQELLTLRRSSHRSSTLQTDRLLTLTTHLAHISEELAMVKKRTNAEVDFWKLDCEKLQQANVALSTDLKKAQQLLEESSDRLAEASKSRGAKGSTVCGLCEKHEARLLEVSSRLLASSSVEIKETDDSRRGSDLSTLGNPSLLTDDERHGLSAILLDLESLYSTLSPTKQQQAKAAITSAITGTNISIHRPTSSAIAAGFWPESEIVDRNRRPTATGISPQKADASIELFRLVGGLFPEPRHTPHHELVERLGDAVTDTMRSDKDAFLLQGSSISLNSSSSNRRKTIVRKVLTEQEIAQRQRARAYRSPVDRLSLKRQDQRPTEIEGSDPTVCFDENAPQPANEVDYSSYIDEHGNEVFYVDIEVEDEGNGADSSVVQLPSDLGVPTTLQLDREATPPNSTRRMDYTIQIPSPKNPTGGLVDTTALGVQLVPAGGVIDRDPEVIEKLRDLVKYSMTAREVLALTNWRILICYLQSSRDKRRLDYVNEVWRDAVASGKNQGSTSSLPQSVRMTMQKLVQYRELVLDAAIQQRDELRRATRRTQAQLIHGVSTVLTALSQKNKSHIPVLDTLPQVHLDPNTSPARQHSPNHSPLRPRYPSAHINLSVIPGTQQIPTPTFPFSVQTPEKVDLHRVSVEDASPSHPTRPCSGQALSASDQMELSVFEHDNRFPQRSVKFVPLGDGEDRSLTHSTSSLRTTTPPHSPTKSPSKAGLVIDVRRRPTHSAEATRPLHSALDTAFSPRINAPVSPLASIGIETRNLVFRVPTRPQSSPAGISSRARVRQSAAEEGG